METSKDSIESHLLEDEEVRCVYHPASGFIDDSTHHENLLYVTAERLLYSNESSVSSKTSLISISNINSIELHSNRHKRFSGWIWASISILVAILSLIWNQPIWTPILCLLAIALSIYFIVEQSITSNNKTFTISSGNTNILLYLDDKAVGDAIKLTKLIYAIKLELINQNKLQESSFALR